MDVRHIGQHDARAALSAVRDRRGAPIDLEPIAALLNRIIDAWRPEQIWLFGSRALGDAAEASDWDLLIVVPDDTSDAVFDPLAAWRLRKESGVRADVVPCRASEFEEDQTTPNTLAFEAATRGVLLFER